MFPIQDPTPVQSGMQMEQERQERPTAPGNSPEAFQAGSKPTATVVMTDPEASASKKAATLPSTSSRHAHLPTPQSPNNFAQYMAGGLPNTPESPLPHGSYSPLVKATALNERPPSQNLSQQIMTPESSPFVQRTISPHKDATPTPQLNVIDSSLETYPKSSSLVTVESVVDLTTSRKTPSPSPTHSSCLSSPFVAKASIPDKSKSRPSKSPPTLPSATGEDFFVPHHRASARSNAVAASIMSTPPISPVAPIVPHPSASVPTATAGGEMERIRQVMQAEQDELESRRPDYLKRTKRTLSEADPTAFIEDDNTRDPNRFGAVGIMESPVKGRRIKLFQETSEESFEESLMAGGYGRYRTAEWVRQPQPMALSAPGAAGPSNATTHLEGTPPEDPPQPPTERELKKQKRLAAFRAENASSFSTKLFPVELEGKGRVLLDAANEQFGDVELVASAAGKKRAGGGKRKKKTEPTAKEKRALAAAAAAEELLVKPNWPDSEFPWRLRTQERAEQAKAEEEERLKWIERFLDRDTDEEDDAESGSAGYVAHEDVDVIPSTQWGLVYDADDEPPRPFRGGRGKMVPLAGDPDDDVPRARKRSAYFPSDPADARAALMSKRSVRALSYRQYRRQRKEEDQDEENNEVLCICRGRDDGRELVQCDSCKTWYHLECIGIRSIDELGREEDPWYCNRCDAGDEEDSMGSGPKQESIPTREPTFAPTEPRVIRSADQPFFSSPSLQDSPSAAWNSTPSRSVQTPTRGRGGTRDTEFSSGSTAYTTASSRGFPTTPRHRSSHGRVYAQTTPGPFDNYDESSFDPTSTPSRGIKFGAPFTTPKNNMFSSRSFHTPLRSTVRGPPGSAFGAPGFLSSVLDEKGNDYSPYDSPIRRARSTEAPKARRIFEPSASSREMQLD
ncbi:hypothetical protein K435DRAFT_317284 [Dendrothele bispora CBS 962.96]|uniref:PHD-type domain-containing protein n=1 Tax=Dendrothele bispora (strain CBS 962.96) TaxID=1314807 RepID=A0A4S8LGQ0_DENBC|nr:hypothetical protein K435DRAFT_317284 [Dendrothele bispora CBS 962.96]